MSLASDKPESPAKFSYKRVLSLGIPALIIGLLAIALVPQLIERQARHQTDESVIDRLGLNPAGPSLLDSRFEDADGDLLADVPKESSQHLTPDPLVFSYVAGPNAEEEVAAWKDFSAHLSQAAGLRVETVAYSTTAEQLQALHDRKLHVSGFNTGAVSSAVTMCGFVPFCTVGRADGTFGASMRIIVPANSPIEKIDDVKNRTVTFTLMDSNSGCKAAIVLLKEYGLMPERDYKWRFSGSHQESIKGIANGFYDAAPVADDLLQRYLADSGGAGAKIRTLYESERFPPATIGHVNELSPELAAKVRQAFLEYPWKDSALEKQFGTTGSAKFVPISYKQDFALVRRIHDAFRASPVAPSQD